MYSGEEGTPYNGLYGDTPPEMGYFFRRQVYERVAILLVEVQEGKSVIQVEKRPKRAIKQIHFMAVKKSRNLLVL